MAVFSVSNYDANQQTLSQTDLLEWSGATVGFQSASLLILRVRDGSPLGLPGDYDLYLNGSFSFSNNILVGGTVTSIVGRTAGGTTIFSSMTGIAFNILTVLLPGVSPSFTNPDMLALYSGNDVISGGGEADVLSGAGNNDTLIGGLGSDILSGNEGADLLVYNDGGEFSFGELADGGGGIDTLSLSGAANGNRVYDFTLGTLVSIEVLTLGSQSVFMTMSTADIGSAGGSNGKILTVNGVSGVDHQLTLSGSNADLSQVVFNNWSSFGFVKFLGTAGHDVLTGSNVRDSFNLTSGQDDLRGLDGSDFFKVTFGAVPALAGTIVDGGVGIDTLTIDANVTVDVTGMTISNVETIIGTNSTFHLVASGAQFTATNFTTVDRGPFSSGCTLTVVGPATNLSGVTFLRWDSSNSVFINGTAGIDTLIGSRVNDTINGGDNDDVLNGFVGADTMIGGNGNDRYIVDNIGDVTSEAGGNGTTDFVFSSVSFTAAAGIERLTLQGTANINATGRADQNDFLVGNSGNNDLNGLGGADTMRGGGGDDRYFVDNIADVTSELGGGGAADLVFSTVSFTAASGIERLTLQGNANINATGNTTQADVLFGNNGINTISGLGGDDVLAGGLGNDTLIGGANADTFRFNTALNATANVDTISDFVATDDRIQLENSIFTAFTVTGALNSGAFNTGSASTQADDRIIYNTITGALLYDVDGLGGTTAVQFATLSGAPAGVSAADFFVI